MGRRKASIKEPVRLRAKRLKGGNDSLYLDIYDGGVRTYEFLRLYIIPEQSEADKARNANTMALAQQIKARRVLELQSAAHGLDAPTQNALFLPFFAAEMSKRGASTARVWSAVYKHLQAYEQRAVTFRAVTRAWCDGFVDYLHGQGVGENSVKVYCNALLACLNEAARRGIIARNPMTGIKLPMHAARREFLTIEELRRFAAVQCHQQAERVRRAFVFSALTGLRLSDVRSLTRDNVTADDKGRPRLDYIQQKTGKRELLDVTEQAMELADDGVTLFPLPTNNRVNTHVRNIAAAAGIDKYITFHSARHTFATMLLTLGTDIYTVSKLLGHSNVKVTQIYAKVIDEAKRKAVGSIPDITGNKRVTEKSEKKGQE